MYPFEGAIFMGPILAAKHALEVALDAFHRHGLVDTGECKLCMRLINPGLHAEDCPISKIGHATRRLTEFQQSVAS